VCLAQKVRPGCQDFQDCLEHQDFLDRAAQLGAQVNQGLQGPRVLLAQLGLPEPQGVSEQLDLPDFLDQTDQMELMDLQDSQVLPEQREPLEFLVGQDPRDQRDQPADQEQREVPDLWVLKDHRVLKD